MSEVIGGFRASVPESFRRWAWFAGNAAADLVWMINSSQYNFHK